MRRKIGLVIVFGLAKRVKNVIFYSNVELPILLKLISMCFSFFLWRPGYFVFYYSYSHLKKKNSSEFAKSFKNFVHCTYVLIIAWIDRINITASFETLLLEYQIPLNIFWKALLVIFFFLLFRARISSLLFVFLILFVKKICSVSTVTPPGLTCEKTPTFLCKNSRNLTNVSTQKYCRRVHHNVFHVQV